ncbi:hypothetical protein AAMO2058_000018900 [Amorphochlora amoebiformis]
MQNHGEEKGGFSTTWPPTARKIDKTVNMMLGSASEIDFPIKGPLCKFCDRIGEPDTEHCQRCWLPRNVEELTHFEICAESRRIPCLSAGAGSDARVIILIVDGALPKHRALLFDIYACLLSNKKKVYIALVDWPGHEINNANVRKLLTLSVSSQIASSVGSKSPTAIITIGEHASLDVCSATTYNPYLAEVIVVDEKYKHKLKGDTMRVFECNSSKMDYIQDVLEKVYTKRKKMKKSMSKTNGIRSKKKLSTKIKRKKKSSGNVRKENKSGLDFTLLTNGVPPLPEEADSSEVDEETRDWRKTLWKTFRDRQIRRAERKSVESIGRASDADTVDFAMDSSLDFRGVSQENMVQQIDSTRVRPGSRRDVKALDIQKTSETQDGDSTVILQTRKTGDFVILKGNSELACEDKSQLCVCVSLESSGTRVKNQEAQNSESKLNPQEEQEDILQEEQKYTPQEEQEDTPQEEQEDEREGEGTFVRVIDWLKVANAGIIKPPQERYKILKRLGSGAFGNAFLAEYHGADKKGESEMYVIKKIPVKTLSEVNDTLVEANNLSRLRGKKYICEFKEAFFESTANTRESLKSFLGSMDAGLNFCIVMEYCPQGTLLDVIKAGANERKGESRNLPPLKIIRWVWQIAQALKSIHNAKLLHRDLKPSNVFLDQDGNIKVGDFGISKSLNRSNSLTRTFVGTKLYMAPEVAKHKPYGSACDVWGLGCIMLELMLKNDVNSRVSLDKIDPKLLKHYPQPVVDLLFGLLEADDEKRLGVDKVISMADFMLAG